MFIQIQIKDAEKILIEKFPITYTAFFSFSHLENLVVLTNKMLTNKMFTLYFL